MGREPRRRSEVLIESEREKKIPSETFRLFMKRLNCEEKEVFDRPSVSVVKLPPSS